MSSTGRARLRLPLTETLILRCAAWHYRPFHLVAERVDQDGSLLPTPTRRDPLALELLRPTHLRTAVGFGPDISRRPRFLHAAQRQFVRRFKRVDQPSQVDGQLDWRDCAHWVTITLSVIVELLADASPADSPTAVWRRASLC